VFALASGIIAQLLRKTVPLKDSEQSPGPHAKAVWNVHWTYGRWASLGGLCAVIPGQIYFFVLSLDGCAAYRAMMNVPMPLLQAYAALGPVFISKFTPLRGQTQFRRGVTQTLIVVSGAAVLLGLGAASCGSALLRILYADKYTSYVAVLWPLMIYSCLYSGTVVLESAMRSLEMVKTATLASATAAVLSVLVGVPAALVFGVPGAAYGLVGSQLVSLSILLLSWLKIHRGSNDQCPINPIKEVRRQPLRGRSAPTCDTSCVG
jgi:O-antigen/teichoic acid export membrane protein